jgi:hypothetical protein
MYRYPIQMLALIHGPTTRIRPKTGAMTAALLFPALLSACAVSEQTYTPDGELGHNITCRLAISGLAVSWSDCYQKANDICGAKGYDVIQATGPIPLASVNRATPAFDRSLIVKCKE